MAISEEATLLEVVCDLGVAVSSMESGLDGFLHTGRTCAKADGQPTANPIEGVIEDLLGLTLSVRDIECRLRSEVYTKVRREKGPYGPCDCTQRP